MEKTTLYAMIALAVLMASFAYHQGKELPLTGLTVGGKLFLAVLPRLVVAFIFAGMVQVLIPRELISRWIGEGSGLRGVLVGTLAGAITPGGPYVNFPIVASLYQAGAGIPPLVAYLTSWSVLGVNRLIAFELPLLGMRVAMIRYGASLLLPFLAAFLARLMLARGM